MEKVVSEPSFLLLMVRELLQMMAAYFSVCFDLLVGFNSFFSSFCGLGAMVVGKL